MFYLFKSVFPHTYYIPLGNIKQCEILKKISIILVFHILFAIDDTYNILIAPEINNA